MTASEETSYEQGNRAAWQSILLTALQHLGVKDPVARGAKWVSEREGAIQSLRSLCREKGDNEWDENLNLQDIIEKHLADHLLR